MEGMRREIRGEKEKQALRNAKGFCNIWTRNKLEIRELQRAL
jgi:hypothetical protein